MRVTGEELSDYLSDSSLLEERVYEDDNQDSKDHMDVDQWWHGLFFLLTGKAYATEGDAANPLIWTLTAPQQIDPDQDMGYGPATYTTIEQTKDVSDALNEISEDELTSRYNGELMMEMGIYPEVWDDMDSLEYLIETFNSLKDFYSSAAAENKAVIIFIN